MSSTTFGNNTSSNDQNSSKGGMCACQDGMEKGMLGTTAGTFPSDTFLWLTLGSIALSASLKLTGRSKDANFVGEWAPTFLGLAIFSKLTKLERAVRGQG
jgi:hypothetical protein